MPICRLCGKDKPLIEAHILPTAFYPQPTEVGPAVLLTSNEEHPSDPGPASMTDTSSVPNAMATWLRWEVTSSTT